MCRDLEGLPLLPAWPVRKEGGRLVPHSYRELCQLPGATFCVLARPLPSIDNYHPPVAVEFFLHA